MGVARLTKVTVISPRSEYAEVAKSLAQFEDFHPVEGAPQNFDPRVQELTVKAVRLFAQADQATKDLELKLLPGQMDMVFRGEKVHETTYEAADWQQLLDTVESQLAPIVEEVRIEKVALQKAEKEEADSGAMMAALQIVSGFSSDLSGLPGLRLFKAVVCIVGTDKVDEFRRSQPEAVFLTQPLTKEQTLALVYTAKGEETRLDKTMKLLDLKPLNIPPALPQNPAEAFRRAGEEHEAATAAMEKAETRIVETRTKHGASLLALRELSEVARRTLDEARVSGGMHRMAVISGYIPAKREEQMRQQFGKWIVQTESLDSYEGAGHPPVLMENGKASSLFRPITLEQGTPGAHEVDPTPVVSFVFPIFFGMMFADVGHGLILTLFMLLVRQRTFGSVRRWANIFLVAGVSAIAFGVIFGEFFEYSFYSIVPIPPVIEIIQRAAGTQDTFNSSSVYLTMEVAILIGVAHLITALSLDVYQAAKANDRVELWLEKVPVLTMYLGGVAYGLAFVGIGFSSFNVLSSTAPAPLLGIPDNVLGAVSIALLAPSMLVLLAGKALAIGAGKLKEGSVPEALSNGGLEVFERITQFMSNTISYVRLAVMLLVHAALLLIINLMHPFSNPLLLAPWVVFNLLIVLFEAFIVYVQDLRLHLYEFFTKFYAGTGAPFRKIFPDRVRVRINWT